MTINKKINLGGIKNERNVKEASKGKNYDEHEKERLVSEILGKQERISEQEEKISKLESMKNELE